MEFSFAPHDPALYAPIGEFLGEEVTWADCYRQDP